MGRTKGSKNKPKSTTQPEVKLKPSPKKEKASVVIKNEVIPQKPAIKKSAVPVVKEEDGLGPMYAPVNLNALNFNTHRLIRLVTELFSILPENVSSRYIEEAVNEGIDHKIYLLKKIFKLIKVEDKKQEELLAEIKSFKYKGPMLYYKLRGR